MNASAQPQSAVSGQATVVLTAPLDVLDACHQQVVATLQKLAGLMDHVDANGADEQARVVAREVFDFFSNTARTHHLDEERHIFPALLKSSDAELVQATLRLQQDHGWLEEDWLDLAPQLEAIANGYSWYDIDALRQIIEVFTALCYDHINLEESMIYPAAKARLDGWDLQSMGREMAERRRQQRNTQPEA